MKLLKANKNLELYTSLRENVHMGGKERFYALLLDAVYATSLFYNGFAQSRLTSPKKFSAVRRNFQ